MKMFSCMIGGTMKDAWLSVGGVMEEWLSSV